MNTWQQEQQQEMQQEMQQPSCWISEHCCSSFHCLGCLLAQARH
jgi:hypothetical protein